MIADDDQDDRSFVEEALLRNAYHGKIKPAENGIDLMHQLQEMASAPEKDSSIPDLILLDLNMPLKDGYQVMQEIKQYPELKNIPILVITSSTRADDENRCRQLGCAKFYQKPLSLSEYDQLAKSIIGYINGRAVFC